ncbi:hypothetical protein [Shimia sp.]|uniref:hypothetical protein n=1 Tax=Shimia sp. TaxID=1954381 RepID=UPI003299765F
MSASIEFLRLSLLNGRIFGVTITNTFYRLVFLEIGVGQVTVLRPVRSFFSLLARSLDRMDGSRKIRRVFTIFALLGLPPTVLWYLGSEQPVEDQTSFIQEIAHNPPFIETLRIGVSQSVDLLEYFEGDPLTPTCEIRETPGFAAVSEVGNCVFSLSGPNEPLVVNEQAVHLGYETSSIFMVSACVNPATCSEVKMPVEFENTIRGYIDLAITWAPVNWRHGEVAEVSVLLDQKPIQAPLHCHFPQSHTQRDLALVRQSGPCSALIKNIKGDSGTRYGIDVRDQYGRTIDSIVLTI